MMSLFLHIQRCCRIPFFKNCTSVVPFKSFHSISNDTQLLQPHSHTTTQVRTFWESFPHIRPLYYEKDGLSRSKYELIYHAKIFNYVFYGQLITSLSFVVQFLGGIYHAYRSYIAEEVIYTATQIGPYVLNYNLSTIVIITLINIQNCFVLFSAQNAVLRVYYCEDTEEFVFAKLAVNPFKSKIFYCKPGELIPLKERMLNFLLGNHRLNDRNLYMRYDQFKSMYHYNKLVGDHYNKYV